MKSSIPTRTLAERLEKLGTVDSRLENLTRQMCKIENETKKHDKPVRGTSEVGMFCKIIINLYNNSNIE